MEYNDDLYISTTDTKAVYKQLNENPNMPHKQSKSVLGLWGMVTVKFWSYLKWHLLGVDDGY